MCVFAAAMMLFALSASFITLLIAWEMLGITSYLLIGFWYGKELAPTAARKAITTIIIGDIAMLLAVVLIGVNYGSFDYSVVLGAPLQPALYISAVLILIAAFTKSAQFPFHEWLSDAMEGPTPVSAFLHSSTMVKAGVFLVITLWPLYQTTGLQYLILAIGLISAAIGVSNALTSHHIKKILAYSTIEDIGLMFVALGLGGVYAALVLFFVQSFYKALLFMGAGSLTKANNDESDIFKIFNSQSDKPVYAAMLVGVLSIAGIWPLSGFFGKYALSAVAQSNTLIYAVLLLLELGSSVYIFRWLFLPMRKNPKAFQQQRILYGRTPMAMVVPAMILAVLVFVALFLAYASPLVFSPSTAFSIQNIGDALLVNVVALAGLGIAYLMYAKGYRPYLSVKNPTVFNIFNNNVITNRIYGYVCSTVLLIGKTAGLFDSDIDSTTYGFSNSVIKSGRFAKPLINGQANNYVTGFVLGIVLLALIIFLITMQV
jgi:NADH-quinone oxidoreductase subunit L